MGVNPLTEAGRPAARNVKPQPPMRPGGIELKTSEVKGWIGGLYIELQLAQKQARDYRRALLTTRAELQQLREEIENGKEAGSEVRELPKRDEASDAS